MPSFYGLRALDTLTSLSHEEILGEPLLVWLQPCLRSTFFFLLFLFLHSAYAASPNKTGIRRREELNEGTSFACGFLLFLLLLLPPADESVDFGHLHQ